LSYDKNGNLKSLNRAGVDALSYNYTANDTGNRLNAVSDGITNNADVGDFRDTHTGSDDYEYYADGSLKKDRNRGIDEIVYNHLKLPERVTFTGGKVVSYTYTATGQKLRMSSTTGEIRDYVGPFQYLNGNLFEIGNPEGRYTPANGYEYYHRDHLGNIRVVYRDSLNPAAPAFVSQFTDYDPWGLPLWGGLSGGAGSNRLKFNGKEAVGELGSGLIDFGARGYDAQIGRWGVADPLGDQYFTTSPFVYVLNMPTIATDPDGQRTFFIAGAGNDGIGWNYIQKWESAFRQGGISNFTPLSASHDNTRNIRSGLGTPINDILFTSLYASNSYEVTNPKSDFEIPQIRPIQDEQVEKAYNDVVKNISSNPLNADEQLNLIGYSYGSVLQAHLALKLSKSGYKVDNLILVGSPISDSSELFKTLSSDKNIGKVLRIDIKNDKLSNPKDILTYLSGGYQNKDSNNTGEGPHFDFARPDNSTYERIKSVVVEWLKQQGVK
jgi:RHS repeat-associated protein